MSKPLEGIRVIEIAQEIQGPFAGLFLADMGAGRRKNRKQGNRRFEPLDAGRANRPGRK